MLICCYMIMHCIFIALQQCFMHFRCVIDYCWLHASRFGLGSTHGAFKFCMLHAHAFFFSFLLWLVMCYVLSLSLSLSDKLHHGTQSVQIHSGWEYSSRFPVIFFLWSSYPVPRSVPWWKDLEELLGELPEMWRSSGMPGYPVGFCWHSSPRYHSDLGLGISSWETHEVSHRVYTRVLHGIDISVP